MSQDKNMDQFFEAMALQLVQIATDNFEEKDILLHKQGDLAHLEFRAMDGEVLLKVVGRDSKEVAAQLLLACFHNLSIEHLGAIHLRPLNNSLQSQGKK
ncbi:hypothetical protein GMLC_16740 [Geomonas limicola]|uniref:Uncharacterized protein n=1 Tax=Geomonas limicola TaxID=2740186 RepID=A0A6V8N686_9BACT|nr:hypothetical protein [Geomonas limicola]GFO68095.1 hypothetical protein GMLC_16740 [Geomonas limicola]